MCMEEHEVSIVVKAETEVVKGKEVSFNAEYEYCEYAEELLETEEMIKKNRLAMIDAYRLQKELLTSKEIIGIRERYDVSQKDFSEILDWGKATITRYENHQIQDQAHDDVLRMINENSKFFIEKLEKAKKRLSEKAYQKYRNSAQKLYGEDKNYYLRESIKAAYAEYDEPLYNGNQLLDIDKVTDTINYFAYNMDFLCKVKLMKLLWYADNLNYKRNGSSITGMVYKALPMGAVPEAHESIISLDNVKYEEVEFGNYEHSGYKFEPIDDFKVKYLSREDIKILDEIIKCFGKIKTKEIVEIMHKEEAYKCTKAYQVISYDYANQLSID